MAGVEKKITNKDADELFEDTPTASPRRSMVTTGIPMMGRVFLRSALWI